MPILLRHKCIPCVLCPGVALKAHQNCFLVLASLAPDYVTLKSRPKREEGQIVEATAVETPPVWFPVECTGLM